MRTGGRCLVALVVVLGLAPAVSAQTGREEPICLTPAVLFCENWEDRTAGSLGSSHGTPLYKNGGWALSSPGNPNLTVDTSQHSDGTKSYRIHYPAPSGGQGFMTTSMPAIRTMYARWYERWSINFGFGCGAGIKNIEWRLRPDDNWRFFPFATSSTGPNCPPGPATPFGVKVDFLVKDNYASGGADHRYPQNLNGTWKPSGDTWYCLEARLTLPTAGKSTAGPGVAGDGYIEGWVDGVKHWDYPDTQPTRDANVTIGSEMMVSGYYNCSPNETNCSQGAPSNDHVDQSRYHDNFVVSTQRIGCMGTTPPPTTQTFTLTASAQGAGTVTGAGSYPSGTAVTPVALAASGSTFSGWSGDCTGTGACTVTMTADKTVTASFTTPTTPPPTTSLPPAPSNPTVTLGTQDPTGVTFNVSWPAVASATSYSYNAGLSDNSSNLQGAVTQPNLLLKTPYMQNGAAGTGFVCIKSVNTAGSSADGACNSLAIPAKPAVVPPQLTTGTLTVDAQITRCNYFLTAEPPDATGGWVAQFYRDGSTKVGNPLTAAPYRRSVELFAPSHSFSVQFTKTGSVMRSPAVVTRACP